jgi:hypothetical protein
MKIRTDRIAIALLGFAYADILLLGVRETANTATIDGHPAPLVATNIAYQGLVVSPGTLIALCVAVRIRRNVVVRAGCPGGVAVVRTVAPGFNRGNRVRSGIVSPLKRAKEDSREPFFRPLKRAHEICAIPRPPIEWGYGSYGGYAADAIGAERHRVVTPPAAATKLQCAP